MIHYDLRCSHGHGFDAWFRDSAAFDAQAQAGLLECPSCGDVAVTRALMAPALARPRPEPRAAAPEPVPPSAAASPPVPAPVAAAMPAELRARLQALRAAVERHCEDVGPAFADSARRIHRGEEPERGIYGQTTPEQAEALAEEGIEVAQIPWIPRADG